MRIFLIVSFLCLVSAPVYAQEITPQTRWFSDFGLAFRSGASFQSIAVNDASYPAGYLLGPELLLSVFSHGIHRAVLDVGYLYMGNTLNKGTSQIGVKTGYQRFDLAAGYEIQWKLLVAGVRVGTALTLVKVATSYGDPSWEVVDVDGEKQLVFASDPNAQVEENLGLSPGFLAGLGVGLALGKYIFGIPDLLEIRAQSDYVRRGARNEFTVWGMIAVWPTRLKKGN